MTVRSPMRLVAAATCPGTHLVTRGTGVIHLYTGPLTPSGRYVPRHGQTACNAHTRRLHACEPLPVARALVSSRAAACVRCTARLAAVARRATPTRDQALVQWGHLTGWQLLVLAYLAATPLELQWVGWLAILIAGYPACARAAVTSPDGATHPPLDDVVTARRTALGVGAVRKAAAAEKDSASRERARARRVAEIRQERDDRAALVDRIGISNVAPEPRRKPRRTAK